MAVKPALNELFGSSPLSLIERHAQASLDCVKQLVSYFEAAQRGDWKKAEKVQEEIVRLEEVADDIKICLLYTSPSPRDGLLSRMPSSA